MYGKVAFMKEPQKLEYQKYALPKPEKDCIGESAPHKRMWFELHIWRIIRPLKAVC